MAKVIDYKIVISQNAGATEKRAAALLQEKIKLICGKKVPLVTDEEAPTSLEIVVGQTNREKLDGLNFERAPEKLWEFALFTVGSRFYITSFGVKPKPAPFRSSYEVYNDGFIGTAHGVYVFIEKVLGYDMMFSGYANLPKKLKSDVVQVAHHGCGNVSEVCYKLIDARYYIWQVSPRFWYSDGGSGLNTRNTGVSNTFMYIGEAGGKPENNFHDMAGILSFSLPIGK